METRARLHNVKSVCFRVHPWAIVCLPETSNCGVPQQSRSLPGRNYRRSPTVYSILRALTGAIDTAGSAGIIAAQPTGSPARSGVPCGQTRNDHWPRGPFCAALPQDRYAWRTTREPPRRSLPSAATTRRQWPAPGHRAVDCLTNHATTQFVLFAAADLSAKENFHRKSRNQIPGIVVYYV